MLCYKNDKTVLVDKNNLKHQKNQPHLCKRSLIMLHFEKAVPLKGEYE